MDGKADASGRPELEGRHAPCNSSDNVVGMLRVFAYLMHKCVAAAFQAHKATPTHKAWLPCT